MRDNLIKHYHFIGIGGIGMSGIAELLLKDGLYVSGSDLKETEVTLKLRRMGADISIGHSALNINGAGLVVYSSAVKDDNPEIIQAKAKGLPILKRAQALAGLMKQKKVITVTGSHGKTTTTSLASCLLLEAGLSPSVAIGGILKNINSNAFLGKGNFFVAEADESDGSFLYYRPHYSIITNIDQEHLDYYGNFDNQVKAFADFIGNTHSQGCVFACGDDQNLRQLLKAPNPRRVLFGLSADNDIYAQNIKIIGLSSEFDCIYKGKLLGSFYLGLGGRHNISNALAVIALGLELNIALEDIRNTLKNYKGASRRLEVKFKNDNYQIIDDYAHHPTEIKAVLAAAKNLPYKRLVVFFQPHRYSRTRNLLDEFGRSFSDADYVILTDIYAASEPAIDGVTGEKVMEKVKNYFPDKEIHFFPKQTAGDELLKILKPGDLVLTLGAGDITKICDELVQKIKKQDTF